MPSDSGNTYSTPPLSWFDVEYGGSSHRFAMSASEDSSVIGPCDSVSYTNCLNADRTITLHLGASSSDALVGTDYQVTTFAYNEESFVGGGTWEGTVTEFDGTPGMTIFEHYGTGSLTITWLVCSFVFGGDSENPAVVSWETSENYNGHALTISCSSTYDEYAYRYNYWFEMAFDANGGIGAPSSLRYPDSGYVGECAEGSEVLDAIHGFTIPDTVPTREGYTFLGWSPTASATSPSYYPGRNITISASDGGFGAYTLYAVWKKDVPPIYVKDGGSWKEADSVYVKEGGSWKEIDSAYIRNGSSWDESQ